MSFDTVFEFEKRIAEYFGSPYVISTDSCTHAIELCLRYENPETVSIPQHTYISIPFTLIKCGIDFSWQENYWQDYYNISNTNIIDGAVYWKIQGYIPGSLLCLSFQHKKQLSLGRGGAILLDNKEKYESLSRMRYDGRDLSRPWAEQDFTEIGYHYYMTPETAQLGIEKLKDINPSQSKTWSWQDYPDLTKLTVFKK
jgi:dTDP-4-amino-4,6-dideoxygalactose transaminase